jgi:hypothetical protein
MITPFSRLIATDTLQITPTLATPGKQICWCEGLVLFEEHCDHCYELLEVFAVEQQDQARDAPLQPPGLLILLPGP